MHIPVLLNEVLSILSPKKGDIIIDATFGGGGHTKAILDRFCDCSIIAIDKDPEALIRAKNIKNQYKDRFDFISGDFSNISEILLNFKKSDYNQQQNLPQNQQQSQTQKFNGILFDFGISSFQIDTPNRGFSFLKEGPLDMRMSKNGISAYDVVNSFKEEDLADIIYTYGDETKSRKIASLIVEARKKNSIKTTIELSNIISKAFNSNFINKKFSKLNVATKTFQAIRIFVNDELSKIDKSLNQLTEILEDNAKIATISFHALEDRIVKTWAKSSKKLFTPINKSIIRPSKEEILNNPRSRSAILRGFLYNKSGEAFFNKCDLKNE